jgi:hypothetical protein
MRKVYNIADLLGEIGGFLSAIKILFGFILKLI